MSRSDVSPTNRTRADVAEKILRVFMKETGSEAEDANCDLLCDLMHLAKRRKIDFDNEFGRAQMHYAAER